MPVRRSNKQKKIVIATAILLIVSALQPKKSYAKQRQWWVKPWLNKQKGNIHLPAEMQDINDKKTFANFLRMDDESFRKLLLRISPHITKQSITRECVSARDKLIITLRYLATGESFRSLMYNFRVHESTISLFIPVVLKAIYEELKNDYLKVPNTSADWLEIARGFQEKWNMPNVIGALDGKHIVIKAPVDGGSAYFNYKQQHSIVLLAMADANYSFTYINVGINGRVSDGGVFWESDLSKALAQNCLNIPEDQALPGRTMPVPFVIVADAAFTLSNRILKPYPFKGMTRAQRIFNYRLSRARRVVENSFGILASRFRILLTTIPLSPEKTTLIVQASCALHNFLLKENNIQYSSNNQEEVSNQSDRYIYGLNRQYGNKPRSVALRIREEFTEYVNTTGKVPWQDSLI